MSQLTLDGVTKRFDDSIVAVNDLSLDIEDGEFLVLVGPSGCGKSTTLRMIAGLESVTQGTITLDGTDVTERRPGDRGIAMVFQSYALYPHMTVRQNMRFGLEESTDLGDEAMDRRVEETASKLDIDDLLDRKPGELSGGQQQRVALGRAIVREPRAFLMDEPLSNLDAKLRSQMRTELKRLQDDLDTTTVYVTHDQTEAMTMGDRIAILDDGELQQVDTPLRCYHAPRNRFVAGFIGEPSMNFFPTTVEDGRLVGETFEYALPADHRDAVAGLDRVTLGIRPEDVELVGAGQDAAASGAREADHTVETTVAVVEPKGNEHNVYLSATDREEHDFVATVRGMHEVQAGEPVVARFPPEAVHLFDATSGEAVKNRSLADLEEPARQV